MFNIGFARAIFATCLTIFLNNAFAYPCPPVEDVRASIFSYALKYGDWSLYSPNFIYHGKQFNIRFDINIPEITDADIALEKGQKIFNKLALLDKGVYHLTGHRVRCDYNPDDTFGVYAFYPPKTY